jgi:hypothetical protein
VPPPPSAAPGQRNGSAASSSSPAGQRLGGKAPGAANDAQPGATAGPPQRPAWGAKAMHAPLQQPSAQATLAYDAADFVPASTSAWQADGGKWHGEDAYEGYTKEEYDTWLQHGGYSQQADEAGCYHESEQDRYQLDAEDSGQLGEWDSQAEQQGRQQGGGSPGADAEEALQQQLSGLHVDEASGHDERSEWLLMCEVRTPVLSGTCAPARAHLSQTAVCMPVIIFVQQGLLTNMWQPATAVSTPHHCSTPHHFSILPGVFTLQVCGKFVLDPEDDEQCAEHLQQCSARHERIAARRASDKIEVQSKSRITCPALWFEASGPPKHPVADRQRACCV